MREYGVSRRDREPLVRFMEQALRASGCAVISSSGPDRAPFRITFEAPDGERMGIIAYAFLANSRLTRNRPVDEHRFQLKYGADDGSLHELWQDPNRIYTTLLVGINLEQGFLVVADPVLHSPTRFFISIEFKQEHVDQILRDGWCAWERASRQRSSEPAEVLVGCKPERFLHLIRFERESLGEDAGHRQWIAERFAKGAAFRIGKPMVAEPALVYGQRRIHALAEEFDLSEAEVLDLIGSAPRLKMAVRGWVAEEHLVRRLRDINGVTECERLNVEGGADIQLRFRGSPILTVECKNVLRTTLADGTPRLDFQRTRASKSDPCSRYYSPSDFDVVAACLHAVSDQWDFRFVVPEQLDLLGSKKNCVGKLSNNVRIDDRWFVDPTPVLCAAAGLRA